MKMNSTQLKGVRLDKNKDKIIKRYNGGTGIHILAGEFDIAVDTLCRRLKVWGVKVRKGDFKRKLTKRKHWKRKFSKEFLEERAERTRQYGDKITYIKSVNIASDHRLIKNILKHPYIG